MMTASFLLVNVSGLGELDLAGADVAGGRELDSLLGAGDYHGLTKLGQVPDNPLELSGGHLDDGTVVGVGDAEALLVQVHQLHLVVGNLFPVGRFEHEGNGVGLSKRGRSFGLSKLGSNSRLNKHGSSSSSLSINKLGGSISLSKVVSSSFSPDIIKVDFFARSKL